MANVDRYKQLLVSIPKGDFYSSTGSVMPYKSNPTDLTIKVDLPSQVYAVFLNGIDFGSATSDVDSVLHVSIQLVKGRNDLKLVNIYTQIESLVYITTRDYATWLASQADSITGLDDGVEEVLTDSRLATSSIGAIDNAFGSTVAMSNQFGYGLEAYRNIIQELRTAYRYYGGTIGGIARTVAAFTKINPLQYPRSFGPKWILGKNFVYPSMRDGSYTLWANSVTYGTGSVDFSEISDSNGVGSGRLSYNWGSSPKKLSWKAPAIAVFGDAVNITASGTYTLNSAGYTFDPIIGVAEPYNIVASENDILTLEFNNHGKIAITLTAGAARTAADIVNDINAALIADPKYGLLYGACAFVPSGTTNHIGLQPGGAGIPSYVYRSIKIYTTFGQADASQSLFNIPVTRGALATNYAAGATSFTIAPINSWWPSATADNPVRLSIGHTMYHPSNTSSGGGTLGTIELVDMYEIDKMTGVIKILSPLLHNHYQNELVMIDGEHIYERTSVYNYSTITINVNNYAGLPSVGSGTTTISINGGMPDGWTNTTPPAATLHRYFNLEIPFILKRGSSFTIPINKDILKYKGFNAKLNVWFSVSDPTVSTPYTTVYSHKVSYDGGLTSTTVSGIVSGTYNEATNRPLLYTSNLPIDVNSTDVRVTVMVDTGGNGDVIIHKVTVDVPSIYGLFLGSGTIPRGEAQTKNGEFMYVWSNHSLTTAEKDIIGVATTYQGSGNIDKIAPDFSYIDRFYVNEYNNVSPFEILNVAGKFTRGYTNSSIGFTPDTTSSVIGSITNMEIVDL